MRAGARYWPGWRQRPSRAGRGGSGTCSDCTVEVTGSTACDGPLAWPGAARVVPATAPPGAGVPAHIDHRTSGRAPCGLVREHARSSAETMHDRARSALAHSRGRAAHTVALEKLDSHPSAPATPVVGSWGGICSVQDGGAPPVHPPPATLSRWVGGRGGRLEAVPSWVLALNPAPSKHWSVFGEQGPGALIRN